MISLVDAQGAHDLSRARFARLRPARFARGLAAHRNAAVLALQCGCPCAPMRLSLRSNRARPAPPPFGRGAGRARGAPPSLRAAPAPPRRFAPSGLALAPRPVLGAPLAPAVPRGRPRPSGACGGRWAPSVAAGAWAAALSPVPPPAGGALLPLSPLSCGSLAEGLPHRKSP